MAGFGLLAIAVTMRVGAIGFVFCERILVGGIELAASYDTPFAAENSCRLKLLFCLACEVDVIVLGVWLFPEIGAATVFGRFAGIAFTSVLTLSKSPVEAFRCLCLFPFGWDAWAPAIAGPLLRLACRIVPFAPPLWLSASHRFSRFTNGWIMKNELARMPSASLQTVSVLWLGRQSS